MDKKIWTELILEEINIPNPHEKSIQFSRKPVVKILVKQDFEFVDFGLDKIHKEH